MASPPSREERAGGGQAGAYFLSQLRRKQKWRWGQAKNRAEEEGEQNVELESCLFWVPGLPHEMSEQAAQKPVCQAGISPFLKKFSSV